MPKTKGFTRLSRYSETDEPDKHGRWARLYYYNGVLVSWVSKIKRGSEFVFQTTDFFPSQDGESPCYVGTLKCIVHDYDFEIVQLLIQKRFNQFLEKVR